MYPSFEIIGRSIPTYWVCALLGFAVCGLVAFFRHKRFRDLEQVDITNAAAFILIGIITGGKLMSLVAQIPTLVRNWQTIRADWHSLFELMYSGMVFYGGLFGALLALHIYSKHYGLDRKAFFDYFIPLFPLFHAFGRVGCFLTGCCHGLVSERFGIAFTNSISAQNGVPYFPIQLVCSALNLLLFAFLLWFERRFHRQGRALPCYLAFYAVGRFIIEFFRGDELRGIVLGLSTSQWISLIVLAVLAVNALVKGGRAAKKA